MLYAVSSLLAERLLYRLEPVTPCQMVCYFVILLLLHKGLLCNTSTLQLKSIIFLNF